MGGCARRGDPARPGTGRPRPRRYLLPALARRARTARRREGCHRYGQPGALSRRLGPRRRPHPARPTDRAEGRGFQAAIISLSRTARERDEIIMPARGKFFYFISITGAQFLFAIVG